MRILVIHRADAAGEALGAMLLGLGHVVEVVDHIAMGVARLQQTPPDVLMLHSEGAGQPDAALIARLRTMGNAGWMPIVCLSTGDATGPPEDAHKLLTEALERGMDDQITLPDGLGLLAAKLARYQEILVSQRDAQAIIQRQRDIHDNILHAVLTFDESGRAVETNLAARLTFGAATGERLMAANLLGRTDNGHATLLLGGRLELQRIDGTRFQAEISSSQWKEGQQVRTTLVVRDITEQLRVERMRDEFLATVSHELRTPLTSVLGAVGLLAAGAAGALPPQAMSLAAVAQRNGVRLSKLIDDILDLTKLEGDRMMLHMRCQPLARVIQESIAANQGYASGLGVYLRAEMEPPSLVEALVCVDSDRMQQVFGNLLSNAIKHSPRGETVVVQLSKVNGGFRVSVSDNGPGIAPEFLPQLFEKFSQEDSSDRRSLGGAGLGLYIARLLVERMGGSIEVGTPLHGGATFNVWLPPVVGVARGADCGMQALAPRGAGESSGAST
ncbi:sensor histidine kinase [Variovorax ginsengisoli]|uniref:histidine kinase n=1 Tax=Variovorax ginsengisoli TaxID=363844 RepID=A0ABT9SD23_9BURK|nr:ATP-binding protein [Variovorax ginsengisoli]MDP9902262.1 signal transduction histidine kinase [Variovorax ginsengisoli]